jgi:hypothetical protein
MSEEENIEKAPVKANFKDILKSVTELNKQHIQSVYVPSVNDVINFKPLTVKQQKGILSSGVDMDVENLTFSNTINNIINDNCLQGKQHIRITDRPAIVLQLRQKALGNELKFNVDGKDYTVDIAERITLVKDNPPKESTFEITVENLKITGCVPDLKKDLKYNAQFTNTIKSSKRGATVSLTDVIGDIYIYEMVKYVNDIEIGDQSINIDDVTVTQAIEIFESLPMSASLKVSDKIKTLRECENITMNVDDDAQIPFDASLFTVSE